MRTRSRLIAMWVSLMLTTFTAACDVVGPVLPCMDWSDTGNCKTKADSVANPVPSAMTESGGRQGGRP